MPSRKRSLPLADEIHEDAGPPLLHRIRSMWEFANLCQWIYLFGKAANIDESLDIEDLETECLKPESTVLEDIGLALLKLVSSHRGLTHEIFDDQTRKQYLVHAPNRNPFGDEEPWGKFSDFDVLTKIRVLQQLTQWAMIHPERIRGKMDELKDIEQTAWRIEPYGWDSHDRTYFVLDDNRVYRLTEPPPRPSLAQSKKASRGGRRSSKRRRTADPVTHQEADLFDPTDEEGHDIYDGLGGMKWECIAITLDDVRLLLQSFDKTRDENEKILRKQLADHLMPILEKQEESRKRKEQQRERELLNLAKMANAKRSSRIAGKAERQKQDEIAREEEQKVKEADATRRREEQQRQKIEQAREMRMVSRDQRLQEREARRLQHEDELAHLSEDSRGTSIGTGRLSERHRQAEIERNRQALKDLEQDEEDWVFDCICGLHGQVDDGTHSVACEICNVWQHSKCLGISEQDADRPDFHFVCATCRRREEEAKAKPKTTIKLKLNRPTSSQVTASTDGPKDRPASTLVVELAATPASSHTPVTPHTVSQVASIGGTKDENLAMITTTSMTTPQPLTPVLPSQTSSPSSMDQLRNPVPGNDIQSNGDGHVQSTGQSRVIPMSHGAHNMIPGAPPVLVQEHARRLNPSSTPEVKNHLESIKSPLDLRQTPSLHDANYPNDKAQLAQDLQQVSFIQNGIMSSPAGLSPIKQPPRTPSEALSGGKYTKSPAILPPVPTLSPSPRQPILTPPIKPLEPSRAPGVPNQDK